MNSTQPPSLPDNFFEESFVNVGKPSGSNESRVTASGYTSTSIDGPSTPFFPVHRVNYQSEDETGRLFPARFRGETGESSRQPTLDHGRETIGRRWYQPQVEDEVVTLGAELRRSQEEFLRLRDEHEREEKSRLEMIQAAEDLFLSTRENFELIQKRRKQAYEKQKFKTTRDSINKNLEDQIEKDMRGLMNVAQMNLGEVKKESPGSPPTSPFDDKYRKMSDFSDFATSISIRPDDSISNLGVFKPLRVKQKKLDDITEVSVDDLDRTVIGGYQQNVKEKMVELDAYKEIEPVSGLPIIFTNPRLNFLIHIHNALFRIITGDDNVYPSIDCADLLMADRKNWNNDPSTRLLEIVLDRTIDSRSGRVIANPFCIPILEPTMQLTQRIVFMAFDQLHKEFETEWFNVMKSVTTPKFHSKYEDMKFKRSKVRSTHGDRTRKYSSSSTGSSSRSNDKQSKSRSVVGSLFGYD